MAEKQTQDNPTLELQSEMDKPKDSKPADKDTTSVPIPIPAQPPVAISVPSFTKTPPNDLYRRLLPAVLFLLTFVTVMTMLLIYMDTVALGAAQFRLNMSRDYELSRIEQSSEALVAYVRQLHLAPRAPKPVPPPPEPTDLVKKMDEIYGPIYNGTFVDFQPDGPRSSTTLYLAATRGWTGVAVRAAARDFLLLRGARALHACLSPGPHPRDIPDEREPFHSRVLCLPLYTVLAAADALDADLLLLGGPNVPAALRVLPFDLVNLQAIEYVSSDALAVQQCTRVLSAHNYTVAASRPHATLYTLNRQP